MPIIEITKNHVRQRCAQCGSEHELAVSALTSDPGATGPESGILGLPPCACGSTEFLIRAPEGEPPHPAPGSFGHRHRLLVDALLDVLKGSDGNGSRPANLGAAVTKLLGVEAVKQWFPRGLELESAESADPAHEESPSVTTEEPHGP